MSSSSGRCHNPVKAQSSFEFLVLTGFLMLIFAVFATTFTSQHIRTMNREVNLFADRVADRAAFNLDLAWLQEEGFSRSFTLPGTIAGTDYTLNVTNQTVLLTYEETTVLSDTVAQVSGDVEPGENTVENNGTHLVVTQ